MPSPDVGNTLAKLCMPSPDVGNTHAKFYMPLPDAGNTHARLYMPQPGTGSPIDEFYRAVNLPGNEAVAFLIYLIHNNLLFINKIFSEIFMEFTFVVHHIYRRRKYSEMEKRKLTKPGKHIMAMAFRAWLKDILLMEGFSHITSASRMGFRLKPYENSITVHDLKVMAINKDNHLDNNHSQHEFCRAFFHDPELPGKGR
jgi:hypothetical protein